MADEGHFTLEAMVGLAIAALAILTAQIAASHAIERNLRARLLMKEMLALEQTSSCYPRIARRPKQSDPANGPTIGGCAIEDSRPHPENPLVRMAPIWTGADRMSSPSIILKLEFES